MNILNDHVCPRIFAYDTFVLYYKTVQRCEDTVGVELRYMN